VLVPKRNLCVNSYRTFIIVLIACVGLGIFGSGTVHATGGFDVPEVNDQFNQFEQSPPPKQDLPAPAIR
jgi:hypothetical protein